MRVENVEDEVVMGFRGEMVPRVGHLVGRM